MPKPWEEFLNIYGLDGDDSLLEMTSRQPLLHFLRRSLHRRRISSSMEVANAPFLPKSPSVLATNVIKSYFEIGLVTEARVLFDEMPEKDVVAWTAMISGYAACSHHTAAWRTFCEMLRDWDGGGARPNEFTVSSVLKACRGMHSVCSGAAVHGVAVKRGVLGFVFVDNALMDMYASCCGDMDRVCKIFEETTVRSLVTWTTLIAGYTHAGDGNGALGAFRRMLLDGFELSPFNLSIAIRACSAIGSMSNGKEMHAAAYRNKLELSIPVMNSILDMYCRCGVLSRAYRCFKGMPERNIISWNTMIAGYEKPDPFEALRLYSSMEFEGVTPDCFTLTSVTASITNMAVLGVGEQVHGRIIKRGHGDVLGVANSLIDMYAKCGGILNSCKIFDEMESKNVISWTAMMIGYGSHGYGKRAVELFDKMIESGVRPDRTAFVAVINACSHNGIVEKGVRYFESMIDDYGIAPDQEIYGCVVDLLGRAGRVKEAYDVIQGMPFAPDESVWVAFLGACKAYKFVDLGKMAAGRVLELRPSMAGTYMVLSNIFAVDGKWDEFARMRKLLKGMGRKEAGRSWIEVRDEVRSFAAGDKSSVAGVECVYEAVEVLVVHMRDDGWEACW
ncbi:putative pentatricopeptide repeat-containing protein At1g56570 [Andrographis paniculata]|uniref:putative pentatricopeptide repeat-containing protein At1g56570 n=1 Tax=Andrographis paniculata TaxID=175694 RepID=UPI0021E828DF|nr:putative pentatricopeptide repeat-containing protein At1g56570 [Andrographis paniculata]